jgi:hypothetical protein
MLLAEYTRRFGSVLNADNAAELFADYAASNPARTKYRVAVHPAAQWIRDELYRRALADPNVKEVVFTAGGNGAGKTTGDPQSDAVLDSTLNNPEHADRVQTMTSSATECCHHAVGGAGPCSGVSPVNMRAISESERPAV